MSDIEGGSVSAKSKGFFRKLSDGDFGLATTYWLFGVAVSFVVSFILEPVQSTWLLVIIMLLYTAYQIPVLFGIWRAANRYEGLSVWAILAKIAVVLGGLTLALSLVALMFLFVVS